MTPSKTSRAGDAMIASGQLRATRASVSVIFGREDPNLNPDLAQHIGRLFENAQLHLLDRASHWPQWDRPELVADLIKQSIAATRTTSG